MTELWFLYNPKTLCNGGNLSSFWLGFHKGGFDLFDPVPDRLDLRGAGIGDLAGLHAIAREIGPHLRLDFASGHLVTLTDVALADLGEDNLVL